MEFLVFKNYSEQFGVVLSFLLGAIIGSFLNVCVIRIPNGQSIISPPSKCPNCQALIRWYQNIPIFSYLFLRGRCGSCQLRISPRYPVVEALTGLLFSLVFLRFGFQWAALVYMYLVSALVVITFIDLDHQIIPNIISLPGIFLGFLFSFVNPLISWADSLFGIFAGGGILYLVAISYHFLTGRDGMGMGDVKLLAMIGAFLGWKAVLPVLFLGSLVGTMVGIPIMLCRRRGSRMAIPFGPFLSIGALLYLLFGPQLLNWYLSIFLSASRKG